MAAPDVLWTDRVSDSESVLVRAWVAGHSLTRMTQDDEAALGDAWSVLLRLHRAGIAQEPRSFVLADNRVVVVRLSHARFRASPAAFRNDVAEFLAVERGDGRRQAVVDYAAEALGSEMLLDVLPVLQPLALSSATRAALRASGCTVDELRAGAATLGPLPTTPAERPLWVAGLNLAPLALGAIALVVLLA